MDKAIQAAIKERKDFYQDSHFKDIDTYFVYIETSSNVSIGCQTLEWGTPISFHRRVTRSSKIVRAETR